MGTLNFKVGSSKTIVATIDYSKLHCMLTSIGLKNCSSIRATATMRHQTKTTSNCKKLGNKSDSALRDLWDNHFTTLLALYLSLFNYRYC